MEAVAILCLMLFLVPVIALIVVRMASPWDEKRIDLLERQVLNLHDRVQELESENKALRSSSDAETQLVETTEEAAPVPAELGGTLTPVAASPRPDGADDDLVAAARAAGGESTSDPEEPLADDLDDGFFDGGDDDDPLPIREPWQPPSLERIAVWIGASVGAFALAIGGLFLVATAIEAGLLGPGFRVGGAMAFGTLFWVGGAAARSRAPRASSGLSAAGAATVFGAIWAACDLYGLLPIPGAFTALLMVVALTMAQASRFDDRFLGNLALLGALLATFVIDSTSVTLQLGYALVLNTVIVALVSRRSWPELLIVVGMGTGLQVLGLTATDLGPARQPMALLGIGLLMLPHLAMTAFTRREEHRLASTAVAIGYLLLATPWATSLSDTFYDPRSAMSRVGNPSNPLFAAAGLLWLLVPGWIAARKSGSVAVTAALTVAGLPVTVALATGWPAGELVSLVAPVVAGVVGHAIFVGDRRGGTGLLPYFPVVMIAATVAANGHPVVPAVATFVTIVLVTSLASFTSSRPYGTLLLIPSLAIAGVFLGDAYHDSILVGPALGAMAVMVAPPIAKRWTDPVPTIPWIAALVAPIAVLPGAYIWWIEAVGEGSVGVVPLVCSFWTLVVAIVLVRIHRVASNTTVFSIGVLGVLFGVTLAIPMQLEERWLTISWALQAALLAVASRRLDHWLVRGTSALLGIVVAVRLLVNPWALSYGTAEGWPVVNWTLYTWGLPTVCLLVAAHFLAKSERDNRFWRISAVVLRLLAMGTAFAMLNVQVSHAFQDQGALSLYGTTTLQGMTRSIVWGGYGMFLLLVGIAAKSRATRFLGFGFLMLSALKVFLLDVWSLPGLIRVGSLMALGLFLIVAAFLFERLVLRRPDTPDDDEEVDVPDPLEGA